MLAGVFWVIDEYERPVSVDRHVVPGRNDLLGLAVARIQGRGDVAARSDAHADPPSIRRRERARASDKIMRLRYARCATMSIERSEKKASGISKGSLGSQQEDEAGGVAGIRCQLDHAERGDTVGADA